jgi:TP901 family phage tail tape measure protein
MPGSSRAIKAARAFVEVFMDDTALQRGAKRVQATMRSMAAGLRQVGTAMLAGAAVAGAPLLGAVAKFVKTGDQIDKMSARTGVAAETLSQMAFALEQSGGQLEDFQRGLKGMANFLQGAERGLSTSMDTMNDLGLTMAELQDLTPDERFLLFANRIASVEDPTRRAALAMDVFGRAGESMLPLLNGGPGAIAALRAEADRLGRTISTEQATNAAKLGDAWNRVKSVLLGVAFNLGGVLAPILTDVADRAATVGSHVVQWVRDNEQLVKSIAAGIAIVGALGASLIALSGLIMAGSTIVGALGTGVAALGGVFTFIASLVTGAGALILGTLSALFSPLGIIAALAIAAGGAFFQFSGTAGISIEMLKETFGPLAERATAAFASIKDALNAGEYSLAAKLLWLSLKEAFLTGILPLREAWVGFSQVFLEVYNDMASSVSRGFTRLTGFLAEKLIEVQGLFSDIDVDEVKATLTEDIERRIRVIDDDQAARQTEIEAQTVQQLAQLKVEIDQTRQDLQTAQQTAADASAAATAAGTDPETGDKLAGLIESLKDNSVAAKVSKATTPERSEQQRDSKDVRSVAGFGEFVRTFNDQDVARKQLTAQEETTEEVSQLTQVVEETRRRGFVIA